jgi:hypothetical protein
MTKRVDEEDRKQRQLRRLGTQNPSCVACGESNPFVLELHHIAGRKHSNDLSTVCANCHRKLSNKQRDHVAPGSTVPKGQSANIGHFLLGLADFLEMIVEALRRFGNWLIGEARTTVAT